MTIKNKWQEENLYTPDSIRTYSGKYINLINPVPDDILIEDIAHALAKQPRFAGHLPVDFSVAQHSLLCCKLAQKENKLAALMHDASEAYLLDIPTPLKARLKDYKKIEANLMSVIAKKFGFEFPLNDQIKEIDKFLLHWEWNTLMLGEKNDVHAFEHYPKRRIKEHFLREFYSLI